jgi:aminoglycoside phosphotransferase (APT) family kinase protein
MESTVYKVYSAKLDLALAMKIWNKRMPTDVERQYSLLNQLIEIGLSLSKPYNWGRNSKGEYILLTSYDGMPLPLDIIENSSMQAIANLLVRIHSFKFCSFEQHIPKYDDFIGYFFPGNEVHSDILGLLQEILKDIEIRTDCFIHGDYNLGNILVNQGHFTLIDWTNAQLGDRRYDFVWASF